jgi:hypothetical protein
LTTFDRSYYVLRIEGMMMDWGPVVGKNLKALRRVLVMLVALAQFNGLGHGNTAGHGPATLPRHLHRFVLRLLRPAEAAARRLIIVAARGLAVEFTPHPPRGPKAERQAQTGSVFDHVNSRIVSALLAISTPSAVEKQRRKPVQSLPMLDPLIRLRNRRPPATPAAASAPDDPLDASRLHRRIAALGHALDDLPAQAQRMARWLAQRDARLMTEREEDRVTAFSVAPHYVPRGVEGPDLSSTTGKIASVAATANLAPRGGDVRQDRPGRRSASTVEMGRNRRGVQSGGMFLHPTSSHIDPVPQMLAGRPLRRQRKPGHAVCNVAHALRSHPIWARAGPAIA